MRQNLLCLVLLLTSSLALAQTPPKEPDAPKATPTIQKILDEKTLDAYVRALAAAREAKDGAGEAWALTLRARMTFWVLS